MREQNLVHALDYAQIFWAMVPGFNVYAATKATIKKDQTDSSNTWKLLWFGEDGPYVLKHLGWITSVSPYSNYGANVRVIADGNEFIFYLDATVGEEPDQGDQWLTFPVIAKQTMKIEMKKSGTYVNRPTVFATIDRIDTQ